MANGENTDSGSIDSMIELLRGDFRSVCVFCADGLACGGDEKGDCVTGVDIS